MGEESKKMNEDKEMILFICLGSDEEGDNPRIQTNRCTHV